jgi:hypothetical protein
MVAPGAVEAHYCNTTALPVRERQRRITMDPSFVAPVQQSLEMLGTDDDGALIALDAENVTPSVDGTLSALGGITVPWDALDSTGPEAACLVADALIAAPLVNSFIPEDVVGPNADLSLRFTTAPASRRVSATATMLAVQDGTAIVAVDVQALGNQLAHGLSTSLLLPRSS